MRDPETHGSSGARRRNRAPRFFPTVHTVGAKDTVDRIINAFPKGYQDNVSRAVGLHFYGPS